MTLAILLLILGLAAAILLDPRIGRFIAAGVAVITVVLVVVELLHLG